MCYDLPMRRFLPSLYPYCFVYLLSLFLLGGCGSPASSAQSTDTGPCPHPGKIQANSTNLPSATGDWLLFRGDVQRTGAAMSGATILRPAWTYCTGGAVFASPVAQAGIAYIASTDRTVAAIDIQHGRVLWQFQTGAPVYSTPLLNQTFLYVGTVAGTLYALDTRTGHIRWQVQMQPDGANIWSSPVLAQGLLIFGVASSLNEQPKISGQIVALDATTGQQRWKTYTLPNAAPGGGVWSSPAIDPVRQIVYAGTGDPDDGVQALRLTDGHLLWHWRSVLQDVSDTDIGSGPLLYHDKEGHERVVAGGKDGWLYSLAGDTGRVVWKTRIDAQIFGSPALSNGSIYAVGTGSGQTTCRALDAETGRQRWQFSIPQKGYSSPVVADQVLYLGTGNGFGSGAGNLDVLATTNGQLLQQIHLHTTASSSPTVLANWVLLGTNNGNVNAFVRQGEVHPQEEGGV